MKIKRNNIFTRILSVILSVVMAATVAVQSFAAEAGIETLYIDDVKLIQAESPEEARALVPEGYTLIDTDLNQGTEVVFSVPCVYMAYSTTKNADEAITDMKLMNMNGGFVYSDYEKQIAKVDENIKSLAMGIKEAVTVFAANYKKGTYGGKAAYLTLSAFTVDEENMTLADYFVHGNVPDDFYLKFLLNVHKDILACVLSALTMAVQGEPGNTWLDRLTAIHDPYSVKDSLLWDQAVALAPLFYNFADTYAAIDHDIFRNGDGQIMLPPKDGEGDPEDATNDSNTADVANTGAEIFYEIAYEALKTYTFGNGTDFGTYFVEDLAIEEDLYPLVSILTPAEFAMMNLCGPLHMILSTAMDADVYEDYVTRANDIINEMGSCSIWTGVNTELFLSSIGITDEANRTLAETQAKQEFDNDGDTSNDGTIKMAGLLLSAGAVAFGAGLAITKVFATALATIITVTGKTIIGFTSAIVGTITGVVSLATGVVFVVVALVLAIIYLVTWLKDLYEEYHPEYTEIPEYMYDVVKDSSNNQQFVLYEAATLPDGTPADVNAWEGREWHALYFSKDTAAGNPIEADFKVRMADGRIDEGYAGLCAFGTLNCENLNRYAFNDDVGGIFITYRQEKQVGEFARGRYLADIKLFSDANAEKCKLDIKNAGYTLYNINVTPDSEICTYIGYQTTDNRSDALTDIRVAYNYTGKQYNVGGGSLTYAASGNAEELTLFTTRITTFGSPILSDFMVLNERNAPAGYEPVNFFSGGPAVSLNLYPLYEGGTCADFNQAKDMFLYFLPSVTYTSGTEYIGGIATIYDLIHGNYSNGSGSVSAAAKRLGYTELLTMSGDNASEGAVVYSLTYNPYRAVYGLSMQTNGGDDQDFFNSKREYFSETMQYDGVGYCQAPRFQAYPTDAWFYKGEICLSGSFSNCYYEDNRLYVQGISFGGKPLQLSDISVSADATSPEGFIPVSAPFEETPVARNLSAVYNREESYTVGTGNIISPTEDRTRYCTMSPAYIFIRKDAYVEGEYLTSVYISSKQGVLGDLDADCSDLDASYVLNTLGTQGAHSCIRYNLNLEEEDNLTYLGYTKASSNNSRTRVLEKLTDLMLYYMPETNANPPAQITKDGARYKLVSDLNLFCEEDGAEEVCDRVYLYATSNPIKGSPIIDITIDTNPILSGWETVRTQNGKVLHQDMDDYWGDMWFIHIKRTNETPEYISEIAVGWGSEEEAIAMLASAGCTYVLDKDLNDNVGAHSDYIYLGYKRTSDSASAITDIRTTHDNDVYSFVYNGSTYYKVDGNLNSWTWVWSDDIFLYYTRGSGSPIVGLSTSEDPVDHGYFSTVLNQEDEPSDLNDGAGGDYIYLIKEEAPPTISLSVLFDFSYFFPSNYYGISSMIGQGSVIAIISLVSISAFAIVFVGVYQRKRRKKTAAATDTQETDDN